MASFPTATPVQGMLLSHLPAVFQDPTEEGQLLKDFLGPFEEILFGGRGLHSTIGSLADYLDARTAPVEFLPWLASWMGTTLYRQLPETTQREFIANASDYYRYRGTRHNLERLLELFTGSTVQIHEPDYPMFQIGVHSTIGFDTYVEGGPPFLFFVKLVLPMLDSDGPADQDRYEQRQEAIAREVIKMEKPAHTDYQLDISVLAHTRPPFGGEKPGS